ncbi:hypothetical protein FEV16_00625 [Methylocystis sp. B8]|nr:hypothetical protein FEV16_00625 [Methylocystis sp. B8]
MEIYMGIAVSHAAAGLFALAVGVAGSQAAYAQANVLKECGSQYQAAKAANELGGQSWQDFLKACRARLSEQAKPEEKPAEAKPAEAKPVEPPPAAAESKPTPPPATEAKPAEPAPPAMTEAKPAAKPAKDTQAALRERQKKCAAEWKAKKAELKKTDAKITWPKYWSECNKRLKAAGE